MNQILSTLGLLLDMRVPDGVITAIKVITVLVCWVIACVPYFIYKKSKSGKIWVDILCSLMCVFPIYFIYDFTFNNHFDLDEDDVLTYVMCSLPYFLILIVIWAIRISIYRDKRYQEDQDFFENLEEKNALDSQSNINDEFK